MAGLWSQLEVPSSWGCVALSTCHGPLIPYPCSRGLSSAYEEMRMRRANLLLPVLTTFYRATIESILTCSLSVWYNSCTAADQKSLQRVVRTAENIIRTSLPSLQELHLSSYFNRASKIISDSTYPSQGLFTLLPSGKRYRNGETDWRNWKN